ncbi:DUF4491 family protein [Sedimentibacter sp.]|uniref:DUF4491 family protein n=1 Tax=Sedimentibacter sp. TaxID=1960295 RepID=UPI0028981033|nr:DUF4491 family protein [Sedimentibacter sp.]
MNFKGFIMGLVSFVIIGVFHPIVIKAEYYIGKKIWPAFLLAGIVFLVLSFFIENTTLSAVLGITGFSSLWSILEIFHQEERVKKGWFPANPKKKKEEQSS